jgi:hypothetical protein
MKEGKKEGRKEMYIYTMSCNVAIKNEGNPVICGNMD